ncbi:hypothetical protein [Crocosphaera chwakensis]|uniref:Uncharacterized protein n=1 Tax=Crocosphaera chwakensis CCY0110 TaxID=391612 RepID=A3IWP7_9CHRO|nr:hypothetical protein [Crocosphaera chwakensis]EAZ89102.1 hypothetical protein CY0110_00750 [Crocosphaera chwakensis CCY0110]
MKISINLGMILQGSVIFVIAFILLGDKILPNSVGKVSTNTRETIYKTVSQFIAEEKEEYSTLKGDQEKGTIKVKFETTDEFFNRAVEEAQKQTNSSQ